AGVGDGLGVERVAAAGSVDRASIGQRTVVEHGGAGQVDRADIRAGLDNGDVALGNASVVDGERTLGVDRYIAIGVIDSAGLIDGERTEGQHLDGASVGDGLVVERVVGTGGIKRAGIHQRAVLNDG